MSEYSLKLAAIASKKKKLLEEEIRLTSKRKNEIANLAEQFNLLSAPNELIAGIFIHAKQAIESKDSKVKDWEHAGSQSLKQTKKGRDSNAIEESTIKAN